MIKRYAVIVAVTASSAALTLIFHAASPQATASGSQNDGGSTQNVAIPTTALVDGAMVDAYDAPSLKNFGRSKYVSRVVEGVVQSTEVVVSQPGSEVHTVLTVLTDPPADGAKPEVITTREPGGVVSVGQVREEFEGHIPDEEIDAHINDQIDYIYADQPHSTVGEHVLLFLAGPDGDYHSAATLTRKGDATSYTWPGEPLVQEWSSKISASTAATLAGLKE